ncbi:DUF397 domain-containing protein [Actinoplanes lobatus]|uniref:DUF397 domain-containing protein n=1 Tax=Actinoplanes lobatus TaxID=113568 RepID=A0A7W7MJG8_9ACTN|nr:DUF397 domain-containing protein [Actinoplanes lobatus]MBB4752627.1 hypothetical protein [Actinoplanes lobatus]GGN93658.1 DUF397 domain-containing protein [Actinoplanes lobatus]GIE44707.1 DUF397 domain-containing protein [Actinoplanes lobatus]
MTDDTFPRWRKSRRSDGASNCVEVAFANGGIIAVRDSKDPTGPVLRFTSAAWDAFIGGVTDDEFDRVGSPVQ